MKDASDVILELANIAVDTGQYQEAVIDGVTVCASPDCDPNVLFDKFLMARDGDYKHKYVCN